MDYLDVVAAIIVHNGQVLAVQRGDYKYDYISYKYEFPGGKVEKNESKEDALIREMQEELMIDIFNLQYFTTVEHSYPDFSVKLYAYICEVDNRDITLTEHIKAQWLPIEKLENLDWMDADKPIMEKLLGHKLS